MDSALQAQGVFFLFAGFSFIAIFYVYFFMDESKGLSDREKKALYIPGARYGRKLRPGEEAPEISSTPTLSHKGDWKGMGIGESTRSDPVAGKTFEAQH